MSLLSPAFKKKLAELQKAEKAANILDLKIKDLSADAALLAGSSLPPPFGTAADVASLAKSVATGDWGGAFWDAVGFIPIVGDGAKAAVKGTKIARRLKAINKSLDKARDIIRKKKEDLAKLCKKKRVKNKGNTTKAAEDCGTTNCGEGKNAKPVFEVSKDKYPNHARVIENAEKKGLPTKDLERGAGTKAAQRNRRRAQADIRKKNGPPPKDHDYDEFPYASSKQGGKGSHVEPVKSTENQAAGRDLGKFYRENGIKKGDKYDVKVTD